MVQLSEQLKIGNKNTKYIIVYSRNEAILVLILYNNFNFVLKFSQMITIILLEITLNIHALHKTAIIHNLSRITASESIL